MPQLLLAAAPAGVLDALRPHLTREPLAREQRLHRAGERVRDVWFPEAGVASAVTQDDDGAQLEVGIFGREGTSGVTVLLGSDVAPHEVFMQVEGHGLRMDALRFLAAVDAHPPLRALLLRYVHTLFAQIALTATSNAHQRMEARLARWLLMCHDRVDGDEIQLTHQFLAVMIGAERSGVTVSLHMLEGAGLIRSTRGRVLILDRAKLEEVAGSYYGAPEAEYRRLIGPFGKSAQRAPDPPLPPPLAGPMPPP